MPSRTSATVATAIDTLGSRIAESSTTKAATIAIHPSCSRFMPGACVLYFASTRAEGHHRRCPRPAEARWYASLLPGEGQGFVTTGRFG